MKKKQWNC